MDIELQIESLVDSVIIYAQEQHNSLRLELTKRARLLASMASTVLHSAVIDSVQEYLESDCLIGPFEASQLRRVVLNQLFKRREIIA